MNRIQAKEQRQRREQKWDDGDMGGSRGGKVLGKTKTGKAVYGSHGHPKHADFTIGEHMEAATMHAQAWSFLGALDIGKSTKRSAGTSFQMGVHRIHKKAHLQSANKLRAERDKAAAKNKKDAGGEGSRGGKIIGHTASGKPIYGNHNHPSHKDFTSAEHANAVRVHNRLSEKYWNMKVTEENISTAKEHMASAKEHMEMKKSADKKEPPFTFGRG